MPTLTPTQKKSHYYTSIEPLLHSRMVKSYAPYVFNIVLASILLVFALRPTFTAISTLQKNIEVSQQTLDTLTQKAKDLSLAQKNYEELPQDTKAKILNAVPLTPNVTSLLKSLESAAPPQASTSAIQIEPVLIYDADQKLSGHPTAKEIGFSYNVVGTYAQITTTLTNLNKLPRVISISKLSISRQSEGPVILSITGKAYYLK